MSTFRAAASARLRDVVDLTSARQARQAVRGALDLPGLRPRGPGGFTPTECAYLADVHDQLQHGSRPTARVVLGPAPAAGATADLGIGA
jgi:hypothetical protein